MTVTIEHPYEIVIPAGLSHDDWAVRRNALPGVGASEAATAMGLSPWKSAYCLYLEKTGELDPEPENEPMSWGIKMEALICDEFAERHPDLDVLSNGATYRSREHPHMLASLDRPLRERQGPATGLLEVKNVTVFLATDWRTRPPDYVVIQVQQQLAVTGYEFAWVAALIGGNRYVEYEVERDEALIASVIEGTRAFWHRVLDRTPPPLDGSDSTRDALRRQYDDSDGEVVELPPNALDIRIARDEVKARAAELEMQQREYENQLLSMLGEHEVGIVEDQKVVTWKPQTTRRIDTVALKEGAPEIAEKFTNETESRVVRFPAMKGA